MAEHVARSPQGGPAQAQALVSAAHQSFADAVAHTSLVGGVAMAVGTVVVALVMPSAGRSPSEQEQPGRAGADDAGETLGTAHGVRSA